MCRRSADGRPNKTAGSVVDVDDWFADHHAVSKVHDALTPFSICISYKSRHKWAGGANRCAGDSSRTPPSSALYLWLLKPLP